MTDQEVRVGRCTIVAIVLWGVSLGLAVVMVLGEPRILLVTWCALAAAAAATVSVRCFLVTQTRDIRNTLMLREDLGQDSRVTPLGHHNTC